MFYFYLFISFLQAFGATPSDELATVNLYRAGQLVSPDTTFVSGERFWMEATLQQTGYAWLVNVGPTGDYTVLYPEKPANYLGLPPVPAGQKFSVGTAMEPLTALPPYGSEDIYLVFSPVPIDPITMLYIVIGQSKIELGRTLPKAASTLPTPRITPKGLPASRQTEALAAHYAFNLADDWVVQVAYIRLQTAVQ